MSGVLLGCAGGRRWVLMDVWVCGLNTMRGDTSFGGDGVSNGVFGLVIFVDGFVTLPVEVFLELFDFIAMPLDVQDSGGVVFLFDHELDIFGPVGLAPVPRNDSKASEGKPDPIVALECGRQHEVEDVGGSPQATSSNSDKNGGYARTSADFTREGHDALAVVLGRVWHERTLHEILGSLFRNVR